MIGRVVSTKMQKTATVLVTGQKVHPLYKKAFISSKKYLADDQIGVSLGDLVELVKIRPISKRKHWQIKRVIGKDIVALGEQALKEEAAEAIAEVLPEEKEEAEIIEETKESKAEKKEATKSKPPAKNKRAKKGEGK